MFIRKRRNPSGSITVAAIAKRNGKTKEVKTFGTTTDEEESGRLYAVAQHWPNTNGNQLPLGFDDERGQGAWTLPRLSSFPMSRTPSSPCSTLQAYRRSDLGESINDPLPKIFFFGFPIIC